MASSNHPPRGTRGAPRDEDQGREGASVQGRANVGRVEDGEAQEKKGALEGGRTQRSGEETGGRPRSKKGGGARS